jgi:hypothetical protein
MPLQYNVAAPGAPPGAFSLTSLLGGVAIGLDTSGAFVMTGMGVAVARPDGTCVTLDVESGLLVDVTALVIAGFNPWVVRVPVPTTAVRRGDIVITSDNPLSLLYALAREAGSLVALDPFTEQIVRYAPALNLFMNVSVIAASPFDLLDLAPGEPPGPVE